MKSLRRTGRFSVAITATIALTACTLAVPDGSELVDERDEGFSRGGAKAPQPVATQPLAPVAPTTPPPEWVGECSQVQPTYVVQRKSGSCNDITATGGRWSGCNLARGVANGFCTYQWTAGTPANSAYLALEAVAKIGNKGPRIVADCSDQKATCSVAAPSGDFVRECSTRQECCNIKPNCEWVPEKDYCKCEIESQPSCDVCGFVLEGDLRAVIDSASDDLISYTVTSGSSSWIVRPPPGTQSFVVPLSGNPEDSTSVNIRPTPTQ
jgi:hypothetical protein